ncbi:NAD(P)H-dependent oxidoreductase [Sulfitobacter sp. S0837]|uniref:FMN-dependent NADH-azoreductase n=1 Tax=Sulfitobacter maritimus TaxID=2741719 RepID=UPI001581D6C8|nr:NAD(P)H-dependent oxidoreductase [Sulfitobacter maritimus]NUH66576.1 NAD(P)H-dependent oxidoreductase [Sulfitobacter maritimus]
MTVLRIETSVNRENSVTRKLMDRIISTLGDSEVVTRDIASDPLPLIDSTWASARVKSEDERSALDDEALALSNALIAEVQAADTIVIGAPIYNFTIPASLKAWIDLIARVGVTFRYTENGPEGLLENKRVIVAFASGGTGIDSTADFASGYLRFVLGFLGITDVTFVAADQLAVDAESTIARANAQIDALSAA